MLRNIVSIVSRSLTTHTHTHPLLYRTRTTVEYLRPAEAEASAAFAADPSAVQLHLVVREKGEANAAPTAVLMAALKASSAAGAEGEVKAVLGGFPGDVEVGPVYEAWLKEVAAAGVGAADATKGVEAILGVKDEAALLQVRKAGHLVSRIGRQVRAAMSFCTS